MINTVNSIIISSVLYNHIEYNENMSDFVVKSKFINRTFEIFIPLLSWFIITMPVWISPFHPAMVAYFIIAFDLYFFYCNIK